MDRRLYSGAPLPESNEKEFLRAQIWATLDDAIALAAGEAEHFDDKCNGRNPFKGHPNGVDEYRIAVLRKHSNEFFVWVNSEEWRGLLHLFGFENLDRTVQIFLGIARGWRKRDANKIRNFLHPKQAEDEQKETIACQG